MELEILELLLVLTLLLSLLSLAKVTLRRLRFPFLVGVVIIGLALGLLATYFPGLSSLKGFALSGEVILYLFLPPLIFRAAISMDVRMFSRNIWLILLLAIPGVIMAGILVAGALNILTMLPITLALLFGFLISTTDPAAVIGICEDIGLPRRLTVVLEGEGLISDATAIVTFELIMVLVVGGIIEEPIPLIVESFLVTFVGGLAIGVLVGWIMSMLASRFVEEPLIRDTMMVSLVYLLFLASDGLLGVSGVLAVLMAGLVVNVSMGHRFSPAERAGMASFWSLASFITEGLLFMLMGITMVTIGGELDINSELLWIIAIGISAVLASRWLVLTGLLRLHAAFSDRPLEAGHRSFLAWGGIRGAVSLALVASLPLDLEGRDAILALTMAVVLFTILIEGGAMPAAIRRSGLNRSDSIKTGSEALAWISARRESLKAFESLRPFMGSEMDKSEFNKAESRYLTLLNDSVKNLEHMDYETFDGGMSLDVVSWKAAMVIEKRSYHKLIDMGVLSVPALSRLEHMVELRENDVFEGTIPPPWPMDGGLDGLPHQLWSRLLMRLLPNSVLARKHKEGDDAIAYESLSGQYLGCNRAANEMGELADLLPEEWSVIASIKEHYLARARWARSRMLEFSEERPQLAAQVELRHSYLAAKEAGLAALNSLRDDGIIDNATYEKMSERLEAENES